MTGNGSRLFNAAGDIRLLVEEELYFNATYCASPEMLRSQFHVTISEEALKLYEVCGDKEEAIKVEALQTCNTTKWSSLGAVCNV